MCRLLGIAASEPTEFKLVLKDAPRSLAALSSEHPDGWGLAIHEAQGPAAGWNLHRGVSRAAEDADFHRLAIGSRGEMLVAHIRQRTVGQVSLENTHPFHRGRWMFAHNGTIKDLDFLRASVSPARLAEVRGQTDSELLFAFFLTRLDKIGAGDGETVNEDVDKAIRQAVRDLRAHTELGAYNFLLANGAALFAHRFGRTLYLLELGPEDEVRSERKSRETGALVSTPWSERRRAVFVSSERLTDETWQEIATGMLLRVDIVPSPRWRILDHVPEPCAAAV
jgi:glutamine amidotransferase